MNGPEADASPVTAAASSADGSEEIGGRTGAEGAAAGGDAKMSGRDGRGVDKSSGAEAVNDGNGGAG